ncbi:MULTISPECIES: hypothetical protein [Serratia]|uniref:hypothetical protein n=1 Tax=Serratia TaxID=613 RepID=UPI001A047B0C|nr:hypothetical protein [Serratia sp. PL7]MBE0153446.1 hypothetical protein [Serratia fonticola]
MTEQQLIPPDYEQCQAEKPNGHSLFSLGGVPGLVRCTNKPVFIATETRPDENGVTGSMSLCEDCRLYFISQYGTHAATFANIKIK